jgi:hypothetical protein
MQMNLIGEGREEKEKRSKSIQPQGLLDEAPRMDTQREVTIEIKFAGLTYREELAFNVKIDTHSAILAQYPLDKMSVLFNDRGIQIQPSKWEISLLTDRRVSGTLYFPTKDTSGNLLLAAGVRNVTLRIEMPINPSEMIELGGTPKRIFQWNVPPGDGGKRAVEKVFWADNDGDMHVSFPALWRAIQNNLRQIQYSRE